MAWLPSDQAIARHPKTLALARMLLVPIPQAIGHLHLLWWWCLDYAPDGDLSSYGPEDIAMAMTWEGDPDALLRALLDSGGPQRFGWLERDGDRLLVHDWEQHAGALRNRRLADAARKRRYRAHPEPPSSPASTPSAGHPEDIPRTSAGQAGHVRTERRGEERTERRGQDKHPLPPHDAAAGSAAAPVSRGIRKTEDLAPQETVLTAVQEAVMQRAVQLFAENVAVTGPPGIALEEMREYVLSGAQAADFEYAWKAAAGKAQGNRLTWAYPRKVLERLKSEGWPREREQRKSGPSPPHGRDYVDPRLQMAHEWSVRDMEARSD